MKKVYLLALTTVLLGVLVACTDNKVEKNPNPNMTHLENSLFATPDNPVISPSGEYKMVVVEGKEGDVYNNHFVIYSTEDESKVVFESDKTFKTHDKLYFMWDEEDTIVVCSGDVGTTVWMKLANEWIGGPTLDVKEMTGLDDFLAKIKELDGYKSMLKAVEDLKMDIIELEEYMNMIKEIEENLK